MPAFAKGSMNLSKLASLSIFPGHGDHVFGQAGNGVRIGVADVAPEKQAAIQGRELVVNLLEEIDIDRSVALLRDRFLACGPCPGRRFRRRRCG